MKKDSKNVENAEKAVEMKKTKKATSKSDISNNSKDKENKTKAKAKKDIESNSEVKVTEKNNTEEKNVQEARKDIQKNKEIKIENIMDTNRLKIREEIREKIIQSQLKRNIMANRTIEIILSLGFILSFVVIFLMWSNDKFLTDNILGSMTNLSANDKANPLLVVGGAVLIIGEKLLNLGNYYAGIIFITLISVICILKIFGIYQAFNREEYKGNGVSIQNVADSVIASILLINTIILSGIKSAHISLGVNVFIMGITIYDIVLTILLVYGMNIRNNIKRYYKWRIESKRGI